MKADYLRFVFECLSGEDGLLNNPAFQVPEAFGDDTEARLKNEISKEKDIDCEICNPKKADGSTFDPNAFYNKKVTLLEYMKHEVFHEYEKAKRQIFEANMNSVQLKVEPEINELTHAPFHPVFLSSLMNQQVFKRECMLQEQKKKETKEVQQSVKIQRETQAMNKEIIDYIQKWLTNVEVNGHIDSLQSNEERKQATNLYELLEKCIS
jgi:hypothetical protein